MKRKALKDTEEMTVSEYGKEEFDAALARTSKTYRGIVIETAVIAFLAIIVAVHVKVSYGFVIGMAAAVYYSLTTAGALKKNLGISYRGATGKLTVTRYDAKEREKAWIPERLLGLDVVEIDDKAFAADSSRNLCEIHLPRTITHIGADAFIECPSLECIYFEGSAQEWEKIDSESDLSSYKIVLGDSPDTECEEVTQ
jgi:hypothetical protein